MTVTVLAQYRCRSESAATVADVLAVHAVASEAEPGCLRFIAHQSLEEPTRFVLYEQGTAPQAVKAQGSSSSGQRTTKR